MTTTEEPVCPGCGNPVKLTPKRRFPKHDDGHGENCLGRGFRVDEPSYPQYVKLWGWERGNIIMRDATLLLRLMDPVVEEWELPWEHGPYQPGELQKMVDWAYPNAAGLTMVGPRGKQGLVFHTGRARWFFIASDGRVGEEYVGRPEAEEAFFAHIASAPPPTAAASPRLLSCGLCYEEDGEEVHPHPECPVGRYPEHEKLGKVADKSQAVYDFLQYAQGKGYSFGRVVTSRVAVFEGTEDVTHVREVEGDQLKALLAGFFGIDLGRIVEEKEQMVQAMRDTNTPKEN